MAKKIPKKKAVKTTAKLPPIPTATLDMTELMAITDPIIHAKSDSRRVFSAADALYRQVGIAFPSLCLQYFFGQTALVLGRSILLAGPPGGCKSSLLDEFMRWHLQLFGMGLVVDAERKDGAQRRESMMAPETLERADISEVSTTEGWQHAATKKAQAWREILQGTVDKPGPGFVVPLFVGVDSIAAVTTQNQVDDVKVTGSAGRGQFGASSLVVSEYYKSWINISEDLPLTLCLISHEKGEGENRTVSGGAAPRFACTFDIDVRRKQYIRTTKYGGVWLNMHIGKNSTSEGNRTIQPRMVWYVEPDPETGQPVQRTYFDWATCTTDMLRAQVTNAVSTGNVIREICGFGWTGEVGHEKYFSKRLGIPEKKGVSAYDFGRTLDADETVCRELMSILSIHPRPYFKVGMDYRAQQDAAVRIRRESLQLSRSMATELTPKAQEATSTTAADSRRHYDELDPNQPEAVEEQTRSNAPPSKAGTRRKRGE